MKFILSNPLRTLSHALRTLACLAPLHADWPCPSDGYQHRNTYRLAAGSRSCVGRGGGAAPQACHSRGRPVVRERVLAWGARGRGRNPGASRAARDAGKRAPLPARQRTFCRTALRRPRERRLPFHLSSGVSRSVSQGLSVVPEKHACSSFQASHRHVMSVRQCWLTYNISLGFSLRALVFFNYIGCFSPCRSEETAVSVVSQTTAL